MSMDPENDTKWTLYLQRYCIPYEFCEIYADLKALSGKTKRSKEFEQYKKQHLWQDFTDKLSKWCEDVIYEMNLTPNKALLYRNFCV